MIQVDWQVICMFQPTYYFDILVPIQKKIFHFQVPEKVIIDDIMHSLK